MREELVAQLDTSSVRAVDPLERRLQRLDRHALFVFLDDLDPASAVGAAAV